ncbi:MAG: hypothetical protein H6695_19165 [Deferribacteres bacterium]|nr:hypothetical protein [candidate division KSB1 bacterium]MCB9512308.1 hypothetical protein [Deferribacteres bacterium]
MGIFSFISNIIKPATDLIDSVTTTEEEKLELKKQMQQIENAFQSKVLEYETKLMENQASIIKAEATGASWLQRSWRPITMLTFLALVVLDSFGWLANSLAPEAWTLLQIGLGGYVVGRSAEKITSQYVSKKGSGGDGAQG